jgi:hypothetical protein
VQGATLEEDLGLDIRKSASGVEQTPNGIAVWQQQWMRGKALDAYDTCTTEFSRCGANSQCFGGWCEQSLEANIFTWIKSDTHMNLSAFKH